MNVQEWWESLPLIDKANLLDYRVTDYSWDSLNEIDKQLIKLAMDRKYGGQTE